MQLSAVCCSSLKVSFVQLIPFIFDPSVLGLIHSYFNKFFACTAQSLNERASFVLKAMALLLSSVSLESIESYDHMM